MQRKYLYFVVSLFIIVFTTTGQERSKVDSILGIINSSSLEEQTNLYIELSEYFVSNHPDSSVIFGLKALSNALQANDKFLIGLSNFQIGKAYYYNDSLHLSETYLLKSKTFIEDQNDTSLLFNLYNYLTYVYFDLYKYDEALKYQNLSIEIETGLINKEETAIRLLEFGMVYEYTGNIEKALTYYNQSLKLYREIEDNEGIADLLNNLGNIYHTLNNYQKALEYYIESSNIQKEIQNLQGIAIADNNIGIVYHDWGQYDKALKYYKKALETERELENENGISESLLNIAVIFHDMNQLDTALAYYNKSLSIAERINNINMLGLLYGNLADLYFTINELSKALIAQEKSLDFHKESGNEIGIADSYLMLGQIYYKNKLYQKSINYYKQSISILEPRKILLSVADCYKGLAETYAALNKYDLAYEYYNRFHKINDSIFSESMAKKLNILEIENRENEIQLLNEARVREQLQNEYVNKKVKIQKVIVIVLIVALIVIISLLILLIVQLKSKRKTFSTLKTQHQEITNNRQELLVAKEQAEESNRLKSAFLVNLSHEIRTPMNGIIGFSQILKEKGISQEEITSSAEQIYENSLKLLNLLNNIIDISSIQTGQLKLIEEKIFLSGLINDIYTQYKLNPEFQKPEIELLLNCNCKDDVQITADSQRLYQVIENIIDNAFKYTEKGKIEISCDIVNKFAQISVSDTGIGIPEDKQSFIFDKFIQLDYSSTRKYEGTGIGLSLSKALIELMNGTIEIYSKLGIGSTFTVKFPIK
ncbi:tetratricopeptide repeat protein [Bacteroidota bacterium]